MGWKEKPSKGLMERQKSAVKVFRLLMQTLKVEIRRFRVVKDGLVG